MSSSSWRRRLAKEAPSRRLPLVLDALPAHDIEAWPQMLAAAFAGADFPRDVYHRLISVLRVLYDRGLRIFDGDRARRAFGALPPVVAIHRGTCLAEHESREYGCSWTVDRDVAHDFALRPFVGDDCDSDAVILSATVTRDHIAGLLLERDEREALVLPEFLRDVTPALSNPVPIDHYCEDPS